MMICRPTLKESNDYFKRYILQIEEDDYLKVLQEQQPKTVAFFNALPSEKWSYAYQPGKWTIKEVLLHLMDTERIFAYRALRISRNDKTELPGFEQDDYIPYCNAAKRSRESLIEEYNSVRNATLSLFRSFDQAALKRLGTASSGPMSPLAIGFIIAGHERHHLNVINERYL